VLICDALDQSVCIGVYFFDGGNRFWDWDGELCVRLKDITHWRYAYRDLPPDDWFEGES
jgi:hypothetical protein